MLERVLTTIYWEEEPSWRCCCDVPLRRQKKVLWLLLMVAPQNPRVMSVTDEDVHFHPHHLRHRHHIATCRHDDSNMASNFVVEAIIPFVHVVACQSHAQYESKTEIMLLRMMKIQFCRLCRCCCRHLPVPSIDCPTWDNTSRCSWRVHRQERYSH